MERVRRDRRGPAVACAAILACALGAGPLDPPAGPVAPTGKTLQQVEPRTAVQTLAAATVDGVSYKHAITQRGSYYLTDNVAATGGGIVITVDDVTVDLNGFALTGPGAASGVGVGTPAAGTLKNLAVVNGRVREFGKGLGLRVDNMRTERVQVSGCGIGLEHVGLVGRVTECATLDCPVGFSMGSSCDLTHCQAVYSGAPTGTPTAISVGNNTRLIECTVSGNSAGTGIFTAGNALVERCSVRDCATAISSGGGTIRENTIASATSVGINLSQGVVERNTVAGGAGAGIVVVNDCLVSGNFIRTTNGAGGCIQVTGVRNRIDGNSMHNSAVGVNVTGAGNLVVRNTFVAVATAMTLAAGNAAGTLVNVAGGGTIAAPAATGDNTANIVY